MVSIQVQALPTNPTSNEDCDPVYPSLEVSSEV